MPSCSARLPRRALPVGIPVPTPVLEVHPTPLASTMCRPKTSEVSMGLSIFPGDTEAVIVDVCVGRVRDSFDVIDVGVDAITRRIDDRSPRVCSCSGCHRTAKALVVGPAIPIAHPLQWIGTCMGRWGPACEGVRLRQRLPRKAAH